MLTHRGKTQSCPPRAHTRPGANPSVGNELRSGEEWEVECLLDRKVSHGHPVDGHDRGTVLFLVRWSGWSERHDSWEPEAHLPSSYHFQRPRGRAPKGKTWNDRMGKWEEEMVQEEVEVVEGEEVEEVEEVEGEEVEEVEEDEDEEDEEDESKEDEELTTQVGGLQLHLSTKSTTGYFNVARVGNRFQARIRKQGRGKERLSVSLGCFSTAVEAATEVARFRMRTDAGSFTPPVRGTGHSRPSHTHSRFDAGAAEAAAAEEEEAEAEEVEAEEVEEAEAEEAEEVSVAQVFGHTIYEEARPGSLTGVHVVCM